MNKDLKKLTIPFLTYKTISEAMHKAAIAQVIDAATQKT